MTISVPIDAKIMYGGAKYCFAKFLDQTVTERISNPDELCGKRDPLNSRTATGRRKVAFTTLNDITVPFLNFLLPLIGTTNAAGTWTSNEIIATTEIIADKVGAVHKYTVARLNRVIIRAQVGTLPVSAECSWIAEDEIEDVGTVWVDGTVDNIFGFPGTTYAIAGVPYNLDRFAFVVDNKLVPSWNSSYTITDLGPGPRKTLLATTVPYIAGNKSLYWTNRDTTVGRTHALVITNGADTITFNFPKGILNPESPSIEDSLVEIREPMTWEAHRQSAVAAFNIVVVNG